jgi:hypothetical protein
MACNTLLAYVAVPPVEFLRTEVRGILPVREEK